MQSLIIVDDTLGDEKLPS